MSDAAMPETRERIVVTVGKCPCGAMDPDEYCCGIQNVGSVRAVLTGRDALVMAWARARLECEAADKAWRDAGMPTPIPPKAHEMLGRIEQARKAIAAFDAAQEGDKNG